MTNLKNQIERLFCLDKFIFLKGTIEGAITEYHKPLINTNSLYDFEQNPIFTPYVIVENAYIVISKYHPENNNPIHICTDSNPYLNIQIIYCLKNKENVLQLGTGLLTDNKIKFNYTETASVIGEITYNCKKNTFDINRFSLPPETNFIDSGEFKIISPIQFMMETDIKI